MRGKLPSKPGPAATRLKRHLVEEPGRVCSGHHAEGFGTHYPRDRKARGQSRQSCLAVVPEVQRAFPRWWLAVQIGASAAAQEKGTDGSPTRLATSHRFTVPPLRERS